MWVSPFRDPWIKGYLLLPTAFRSLSRLSSALSAKASALCSFLLNLLLPLHSVAASALFLVFCSGIPPLPESLSALFDVFSLFLDLQYSVFKVQYLIRLLTVLSVIKNQKHLYKDFNF